MWKFGKFTNVFRLFENSTYSQLVQNLWAKWTYLKVDSISLSDLLLGHSYCMLKNDDDDLLVIFFLVSPKGIDCIDVIMRNYGSVGNVGIDNETVVVADFDGGSSKCSGSKKQNYSCCIDLEV